MSLDPAWLVMIPLLVGHVSLLVAVTNVTHAFGLPDRLLDVLKLFILAALIAVAALFVVEGVSVPLAGWPWALRAYSVACVATGLVGLPMATAFRHGRRLPSGIVGRASLVDLAADESKDAFIGSGKHSWMLRLPGNESFHLRKLEWEVAVPNLPAEWDGLSLVHLTDLHFAPCFRRRYFEVVAEEASAWDADIVAFTGDLIDNDSALEWIEPVMSRLRGRHGTFSILGNHDLSHHPREIRAALDNAGFVDVDGRWLPIEIERNTLAIGGTSSPWGPRLDYGSAPEADFRLVLSHTPDRFATAVRGGADLVLTGHNHAGQIRLPLVGPVFMPSVYSRHYDRGFFRADRTLMYVSQGVAGKHPIRYGDCSPELTRFVLRVAGTSTTPTGAVHAGTAGETVDSRG